MNPSAPIQEILVLHHSHTDIGYTHPPAMVWELHRRFTDEAIELCEATAELPEASRVRWTCETTAPLLYWLEHAPARQIARFRKLVRRGQIGAGAMFLNLTPLSNAETLVRGLEPIGLLRKELGLPLKVAINHDVNGLPWPIADLLLDAGVDMLLMGINIHFGGYPMQRPRGFAWQAPSGRALLAFNAEHYQSFDREARVLENSLDAMAEGLSSYLARLQATGYRYDFAYLSATNPSFPDNNPPNRRTADLIRRWNDEGRLPRIRFVLPEELATRLAAQPSAYLPSHAGDWTDFWNFGSGSSAVETKVSRHARHRLTAAETLRALTPLPTVKAPPHAWAEAWRNLLYYEEHTWSIYAALRTTPPEPVNEQWYEKAITAYQANSAACLLFRDAIELWAGPAASGDTFRGLMLINPAPVEKTGWARVPTAMLDGKWDFFSSNVLQLEVHRHLNTPPDHGNCNAFCAPAPTVLAGPFTLPPFGFRFIPRSEIAAAEVAVTVKSGSDFIESSYYRLTYDRRTGRILQLHDKVLQRDLLDAASPWAFFGLVQETIDDGVHPLDHPEQGRQAFFDTNWTRLHLGESCWNPEWSARRRPASQLLEARTLVTPEGASLLLRWEAPGVEDFIQKITLDALQPRVSCTASFNKTDVRSAEGLYFTFPFALSDWRAHFDTAGIPVEFEHEQLPGACRDWVTIDSWVALHDAHGAVTLACPDAPLVQIGDFRFARGNQTVNRRKSPLLLAWPMNNYWNTNFRASQPGYAQFHYVLASYPTYDPATSARVALAAQADLEWQPLAHVPAKKRGQFASVRGDGVLLLGASVRARRVVLRLLNLRTDARAATVRVNGRAIGGARRTDATGGLAESLTVRDGALHVTIPPRSLLLVSVVLETEEPNGRKSRTTGVKPDLRPTRALAAL
jgi:alpha-mannosidase